MMEIYKWLNVNQRTRSQTNLPSSRRSVSKGAARKTASENVGKKRGEKKLCLAALLSFIFAKQM